MHNFFKKPVRKGKNKMIDGVCSGIAESIEIDPFWIRLIFILLFCAGKLTGIMVLIYIFLSFIMSEPSNTQNKKEI